MSGDVIITRRLRSAVLGVLMTASVRPHLEAFPPTTARPADVRPRTHHRLQSRTLIAASHGDPSPSDQDFAG